MAHLDEQSNGSIAESLSLNERRKAALEVIDDARFNRFHFKVCLVAGLGFFTDAYDIFAISIASTMIGIASKQDYMLSQEEELALKMATLVGTLFGQLIFGWLADRVGRKSMYGIELIIMTISTFGQALSGGTTAVSTIGAVVIWRFIMGTGIGGDYPLSAVIVSESVPINIRGRLMTLVVASQGWGNLAAALTAMVSVYAFKKELSTRDLSQASTSVDRIWRLIVGLGCVPAVIGIYFRFTIPETPRFTMDIERNLKQAEADINTSMSREETNYRAEVVRRVRVPKPTWNDFIRYFSRWENLRILIGVAYSWFAIDVTFYGINLNATDFLQPIIFRPTSNNSITVYDTLYNASVTNIVASAGSIPGYYATFLLVDSWGRKPIQCMGFIVLAILFIITGNVCVPNAGPAGATIVLYTLINFFQNFGPNTTTFIIPGGLFPTRYRSTCHGIAGACGKLGATIALATFYAIQRNYPFPNRLLMILAIFMLTGMGTTLWLPETSQKSLEELSNEDQEGFVQGYGHDDGQEVGHVDEPNDEHINGPDSGHDDGRVDGYNPNRENDNMDEYEMAPRTT
ncbi:phosphate permease [Amanita muscaria]